MKIESPASEPIGNNESCKEILYISQIKVFSPIFIHLPAYDNDDILSAEHFENSKTSRGSYFHLLVVFLSKSLNSISFPSPFTVNLIREADDELQPVGHHSGRQFRPRR
jgi:hypothetical protein